jgi:hypothetical protein
MEELHIQNVVGFQLRFISLIATERNQAARESQYRPS